MSLGSAFERVLRDYSAAKQQDFAAHPLATFIRKDLPALFSPLNPNPDRFQLEGSPGKGKWVDCPWLVTLDLEITESAQRGYYLVYLVREDMSGFYLSLNQGVTDVQNRFGGDAKRVLQERARSFRLLIGDMRGTFDLDEIDLRPRRPSGLSAYYQAGNIAAVVYDAASIPSDDRLKADYLKGLALYQVLSTGDEQEVRSFQQEEDEANLSPESEDFRQLRLHKRVERNRKLAEKVKRLKGHRCEACDMSFADRYGDLGAGYIEAHHLTPVSKLKGQMVTQDPMKDFAVLCANCHRMIHRQENSGDVAGLRALLRGGALR